MTSCTADNIGELEMRAEAGHVVARLDDFHLTIIAQELLDKVEGTADVLRSGVVYGRLGAGLGRVEGTADVLFGYGCLGCNLF